MQLGRPAAAGRLRVHSAPHPGAGLDHALDKLWEVDGLNSSAHGGTHSCPRSQEEIS